MAANVSDLGHRGRLTVGHLGVGSKFDDRRAHLQAAVSLLGRPGVEVLASSSTYETQPVGEVLAQAPSYVNACLRVRSSLGAQALVNACKAVEREVQARRGGCPSAPRAIDIDLLLLVELTHTSTRLPLPHPDVLTRRYVLIPLLELDPDLALPDGTRIANAERAQITGQLVTRASPPLSTPDPVSQSS